MPFRRVQTRLAGPVLIEPTVHRDGRGFFVETFRASDFAELGIDVDFVQENQSRSGRGTIRALHFQRRPGQAKLVRATSGAIHDVLVDLRRDSPTFGEHEAFDLDDRDCRQLFVPIGFAHGFAVTSEVADVSYRVSSYYDPAEERGVAWDDPDIGIEWPLADPVVSDRDRSNPRLSEIADQELALVTPNVEIARRGWEAFNRRDLETVLDTIHPDIEWRPAQGPGGIEGQVYRGHDEYRQWLYKDLPEVWEAFHAEELEVVDAGDDRVIASGYVVGTGRGSGAEVRVPFSQLAWFRDGKVVRIDGFMSREGAREAAGL